MSEPRGWPAALALADDGRLRFDGCDLETLAATFGTPVWVLSRSMIEANFVRFGDAFRARLPATEVAYSMKANNTLAVVRMLARLGAKMDCTGESEVRLALGAGVPAGDIIVNGNGKSDGVLRAAAELGVRQVNLDSIAEAGRLEELARAAGTVVPCAVRVQLTYRELLAADESFESTLSIGEGKFGCSVATGEALRVIDHTIASPHLRFVGLHHHVGFSGYMADYAPDREVMHHAACTRELCELARRIRRELGARCERFDLGGGFRGGDTIYLATPGGTDGELHPLPELGAYVEAIAGVLERELPGDERPTVQFETGGYQIADAVLFLARVVEVKEHHGAAGRRFVTIDGSMQMFTSKGTMRVASEAVVVGRPAAPPAPGLTDLVGQTCVYDSAAEAIAIGPVAPGDLVALLKHGAYCDTSGTQMNATPRPGSVLADAGTASLVRRAETWGDVAGRDSIPPSLWAPADRRASGSLR